MNEPTADRATVVVTASNSNGATVEFGGQSYEFGFSEKVKQYNPKGLEVGAVYDISYSADLNQLFYAKKSAKKSSPETSQKKDYPPENNQSVFDYKQDLILAQSTLKEAVKIYLGLTNDGQPDFNEITRIHRELFKYMKEEGYK